MNEQIHNLPESFLWRLEKIFPDCYGAVCQTLLQKRPTTFRVNLAKTTTAEARKMLNQQHIGFKEIAFPAGSFLLTRPTLRQLQTKKIYTDGFIFVQNISSMIPAIVLDPQPGESILDLCAAPGAKTTQLAGLAPKAEIIAIEKSRKRYYKLLANLKQQGISSVKVMLTEGAMVRKKFPEYFDKILIDAPCSSEGRFFVEDRHSYKYWKIRKIKEMVHTQKKLLAAAFYALKSAGLIVYSTCTFAPEENEEVIDWFVHKFSDYVEIEPIKLPIKNVMSGLSRWRDTTFFSQIQRTKRIIPDGVMEGFFLAKIRKV